MTLKNQALLFVSIFFMCNEIFAADWLQIHQNKLGDTLFIDVSSVEKHIDIVRYTEKMVFVTPRLSGNKKLNVLIAKYEINCANQTNAPLELEAITVDGEVIGLSPEDSSNPKFFQISTNPSAADRITYKYFCLGSK